MKRTPLKRKTPMKRQSKRARDEAAIDRAVMPTMDVQDRPTRKYVGKWAFKVIGSKPKPSKMTPRLRRLDKVIAKKRKEIAHHFPKPRKPLPKQSPKAKARNAEYSAAKKQWRASHDGRCEMMIIDAPNGEAHAPRDTSFQGSPGGSLRRCRRRAQKDPHHMALRGPNLCKVETFLGVCRECHDWIHANANAARSLGYLAR